MKEIKKVEFKKERFLLQYVCDSRYVETSACVNRECLRTVDVFNCLQFMTKEAAQEFKRENKIVHKVNVVKYIFGKGIAYKVWVCKK